MGIKKAGITCESCGWEALVNDMSKEVFCQNPECMTDGKFKRIKPRYQMYIPDGGKSWNK